MLKIFTRKLIEPTEIPFYLWLILLIIWVVSAPFAMWFTVYQVSKITEARIAQTQEDHMLLIGHPQIVLHIIDIERGLEKLTGTPPRGWHLGYGCYLDAEEMYQRSHEELKKRIKEKIEYESVY